MSESIRTWKNKFRVNRDVNMSVVGFFFSNYFQISSDLYENLRFRRIRFKKCCRSRYYCVCPMTIDHRRSRRRVIDYRADSRKTGGSEGAWKSPNVPPCVRSCRTLSLCISRLGYFVLFFNRLGYLSPTPLTLSLHRARRVRFSNGRMSKLHR